MADLTGRRQERPRPPLTKRMRRGHWVALDCAVGAFAALITVIAQVSQVRPLTAPFPGRILLTLVLAAAIFVPVGFRRVRPVLAYGALVLLAALLALDSQRPAQTVLLGAGYVLYVVTVEASRRTGIAALALGLAPAVIIFFNGSGRAGTYGGGAIPIAFVLVISWMIGYAVRQRRLYADTLQEQAASKAVAEERLRIARELHDVVAHSMSVIAVQAGFGQYVIDSSPEDARGALGAIQATSRDALEEMRRMLGVLRQRDVASGAGPAPGEPGSAGSAGGPGTAGAPGTLDGSSGSLARAQAQSQGQTPAAPLAPAPGLARLGRLVERTSGTGVRVSLEQSGTVRDVPAGVDLSAYRIAQEALTNVVRHAGAGASCTVSIQYGDDALVVEVTDDGGARGTGTAWAARGETAAVSGGHGIIGMRERAALCGGSLEAGPAPDGGFRVTATLPLHPARMLAGGTA
ncbi:MAG TPA: sensor histidine kinase [Trebonia sp.]